MLVDSHCHLDFPQFHDDLEAVLKRAESAGVEHVLTIVTNPERLPANLRILDRFPRLFAAVGLHPHELKLSNWNAPQELEAMLASHPRLVGIGECGLDYHYHQDNKSRQKAMFGEQIAVAQKTGLPLIVHTRNAEEDTLALLTKAQQEKPFPCLIHCFSGSRSFGERCLEEGFYISFSGIVTFNKATEVQELARAAPLERLLVETDAPYLAPVPKRGKPNEPAFVAYTARFIAELRGLSLEKFAKATSDNFFRLFSKAEAFRT